MAAAISFSAATSSGSLMLAGAGVACPLSAEPGEGRPDAALRINARIKERGMENGLICYPMGGIVDGKSGDHVMLAPPYIINESHIAEIMDKLGRTVDSVLREALVKAA